MKNLKQYQLDTDFLSGRVRRMARVATTITLIVMGFGCAVSPDAVVQRTEAQARGAQTSYSGTEKVVEDKLPLSQAVASTSVNNTKTVIEKSGLDSEARGAVTAQRSEGETSGNMTVRETGNAQAGGKPAATANTQLQRVEKLIEESSAAQQVAGSEVQAAHAKREEARQFYRQAQQAGELGDTEKMNQLLKDATSTMFDAVRLAGRKDVVAINDEQRFRQRLDSVKVLLEAHSRISGEKDSGVEGKALVKKLQPDLDRAEQLAEQGDLSQALALVNAIYNQVRASVQGLREGDTLVRTLHFANKEEEYHYEVDRNDTHKMLVTMLLQEKLESKPDLSKMVDPYLQKADAVRSEAEKLAGQGKYGEAIERLEESTKHLVRAIRGAGVYIPG